MKNFNAFSATVNELGLHEQLMLKGGKSARKGGNSRGCCRKGHLHSPSTVFSWFFSRRCDCSDAIAAMRLQRCDCSDAVAAMRLQRCGCRIPRVQDSQHRAVLSLLSCAALMLRLCMHLYCHTFVLRCQRRASRTLPCISIVVCALMPLPRCHTLPVALSAFKPRANAHDDRSLVAA